MEKICDNYKLYDYQKNSIKKMEKMERLRKCIFNDENGYEYKEFFNCGIFGNPVGSGKTLCVLNLIKNNKMIKDKKIIETNFRNEHGFAIRKRIMENYINTTLIYSPFGPVYKQWINIIEELNFKYYAIENSKNIENIIKDQDKENFLIKLNEYDIIVVTNNFISKFLNEVNTRIKNYMWKRIVIDEPDSIKIKNERTIIGKIIAQFTWYVTATSSNLCRTRNSSFIRNIFVRLNNKALERRLVNFENEYLELLNQIPIKNIIYRCKNPIKAYNLLSSILDPRVIDLVNANDFSGAISLLGGKVGSEKEIIEYAIHNFEYKIQKLGNDLNNKIIRKNQLNNLINLLPQNNNYNIQRIQQLNGEIIDLKENIKSKKIQIKRIKEIINSEENINCPICFENMISKTILECSHIFCTECIIQCIKSNNNKCPECRTLIKKNSMMTIGNINKEGCEECEELKSKDDAILEIIKENPKGKYLIFSNYDGSFNSLDNKLNIELSKMKIVCKILKGRGMKKSIEKFKSGLINVLMLNSKYNGAGINLPMTTDIILLHKFKNLDLEKQVIGRAKRLGRDFNKELKIHRLIYENE